MMYGWSLVENSLHERFPFITTAIFYFNKDVETICIEPCKIYRTDPTTLDSKKRE